MNKEEDSVRELGWTGPSVDTDVVMVDKSTTKSDTLVEKLLATTKNKFQKGLPQNQRKTGTREWKTLKELRRSILIE